jgi:hypothetical protein
MNNKAVQTALDHLANPAQVAPEVGERLRDVLAQLDASDDTGKALAELLRGALTYPGSRPARSAASAIHAALQTQQGRKAAGLKPRGRSKQYDPAKAALSTIPASIALRLSLGEISRAQAIAALIGYLGGDADERTAGHYLDDISPRVEGIKTAVRPTK